MKTLLSLCFLLISFSAYSWSFSSDEEATRYYSEIINNDWNLTRLSNDLRSGLELDYYGYNNIVGEYRGVIGAAWNDYYQSESGSEEEAQILALIERHEKRLPKFLDVIINYGYDVNHFYSNLETTPLYHLVRGEDTPEVLKAFITRGADPNWSYFKFFENDGESIFWQAILTGNHILFQTLKDYGLDTTNSTFSIKINEEEKEKIRNYERRTITNEIELEKKVQKEILYYNCRKLSDALNTHIEGYADRLRLLLTNNFNIVACYNLNKFSSTPEIHTVQEYLERNWKDYEDIWPYFLGQSTHCPYSDFACPNAYMLE